MAKNITAKSLVAALALIITLSIGAAAQEPEKSEAQRGEHPLIGKWICDMTMEAGLFIELNITENEFTVKVDQQGEIQEMQGAFEFKDNKLLFQTPEGDAEGEYDPEKKQIGVYYQEMYFVFEREVPKDAKKPEKVEKPVKP